MVRLFSALLAVVIAAMLIWLSLRGADSLGLLVLAHPIPKRLLPLFGAFSGMFAAFFSILIARKRQQEKRDEDVPLTPMVRRLPSGLREL